VCKVLVQRRGFFMGSDASINPISRLSFAQSTSCFREAQRIVAGDYIRKPLILEKIGLGDKNELAQSQI
jgi:hypothetical protein